MRGGSRCLPIGIGTNNFIQSNRLPDPPLCLALFCCRPAAQPSLVPALRFSSSVAVAWPQCSAARTSSSGRAGRWRRAQAPWRQRSCWCLDRPAQS